MFMTTPSDNFMMIIAQMVNIVYLFSHFFVKNIKNHPFCPSVSGRS